MQPVAGATVTHRDDQSPGRQPPALHRTPAARCPSAVARSTAAIRGRTARATHLRLPALTPRLWTSFRAARRMAILVDHDNLNNVPASECRGRAGSMCRHLNRGPDRRPGHHDLQQHLQRRLLQGHPDPWRTRYGVQVSTTSSPSCQTRVAAVDPHPHRRDPALRWPLRALSRATTSTTTATSAGGSRSWDDGDNNSTIEDNVWVCTCIYPWSIQADDAGHTSIFRHNTFAGGGGVHFQHRSGYPASNHHSRQRVHRPSNGITDSSGANWGTQDHNLNSGLSGPGDITGTPVWTGGSSRPATAAITSPPVRPGRAQPPTAPTWAYADAQEVCETVDPRAKARGSTGLRVLF